MLTQAEYASIKEDYKRVSVAHFPRDYFEPTNMRFANSDALFPTPDLRSSLEEAYQTQCANLCYGPFPAFEEVLRAFESVCDRI